MSQPSMKPELDGLEARKTQLAGELTVPREKGRRAHNRSGEAG